MASQNCDEWESQYREEVEDGATKPSVSAGALGGGGGGEADGSLRLLIRIRERQARRQAVGEEKEEAARKHGGTQTNEVKGTE